MLPDDYLRKLKQDLSEVEAQVKSETHYEPDLDSSVPPKPRTSGVPPLRRCTRLPLGAARAPVTPWGEPSSESRYEPDSDFSPPPADLTSPPASPNMSAMRIGVLLSLLTVLTLGCHKVPYQDLMDAPQQVEIDDRAFTLDALAWSDYVPGVYEPTALNVSFTLTGNDTTRPFPSTLRADRLWAIRSQDEIWEVVLSDPCPPPNTHSICYLAGNGPKWPAGIWVSVAARVRSDDGRTWLLRDPEVYIPNPEGGSRVQTMPRFRPRFDNPSRES